VSVTSRTEMVVNVMSIDDALLDAG